MTHQGLSDSWLWSILRALYGTLTRAGARIRGISYEFKLGSEEFTNLFIRQILLMTHRLARLVSRLATVGCTIIPIVLCTWTLLLSIISSQDFLLRADRWLCPPVTLRYLSWFRCHSRCLSFDRFHVVSRSLKKNCSFLFWNY